MVVQLGLCRSFSESILKVFILKIWTKLFNIYTQNISNTVNQKGVNYIRNSIQK